MRDEPRVLCRFKLLQVGLLIILGVVYAVSTLVPDSIGTPPTKDDALAGLMIGFFTSYIAFSLLFIYFLWRLPRIREHYRRLPTRKELYEADPGFLQYGSFFFRRQDLIGHGATACVYKGMLAGRMVAVKELLGGGTVGRSEAALLARLRHPHVLQFFGCSFSSAGRMYLVMELMDMSLQDFLDSRAPLRLPRQEALAIGLQVAQGLQYLHVHSVCHRDLKPGNILLSFAAGDRTPVAKLGDFGLSRSTAELSSMTAVVGTIQYMAPEMLQQDDLTTSNYGPAVDVFSFGIILWQLLTSARPYEAAGKPTNRFLLLHRIAREGLRPPMPPWAPPPLAALLGRCWSEAESARPTAAELVLDLIRLMDDDVGYRSGEPSGEQAGCARVVALSSPAVDSPRGTADGSTPRATNLASPACSARTTEQTPTPSPAGAGSALRPNSRSFDSMAGLGGEPSWAASPARLEPAEGSGRVSPRETPVTPSERSRAISR
jgi:serine/threonine protein kinase